MSYYSPTGNPGTAAAGLSSAMRAEFAAIAAGFALLPNYSGNANKFVVVNSSGTGLTTTATPTITSLTLGSLHVTGTASFDSSIHVNGIQSQDASPVSLLGGAAISLGDLAVAPSGNNSGSLIVSVSDDGNPTGLAQGTLYGRFASLHGTGIGWNLYQPDQGATTFNYRQSPSRVVGEVQSVYRSAGVVFGAGRDGGYRGDIDAAAEFHARWKRHGRKSSCWRQSGRGGAQYRVYAHDRDG